MHATQHSVGLSKKWENIYWEYSVKSRERERERENLNRNIVITIGIGIEK